MSLQRPAASLRQLFEEGADPAAALTGVRAVTDDPERITLTLREVLGCSELDVAWVQFWVGDTPVLSDEEAVKLFTWTLERSPNLADEPDRWPAARGLAWSAEERRYLLAHHAADLAGAREARQAEEDDRAARLEQRWLLWRQLYVNATPYVPMARCPFTDQIVLHSTDPDGLDGLWWDAEAVHRPPEDLPPTWFALTGAVRQLGPIPKRPWLIKPGPEVPFVIPRLLEAGLTAVMVTVDLGEHLGYAITYFAAEPRPDVEPTNTWGLRSYPRFADDGAFLGYGERDDEDDYDYDLAPWIRSGSLLWISPDDPDYRLRDTVEGCRYLDLDGRRRTARIRGGTVRWPD